MRPLWRISGHCDLIGLGGEVSDGRWHSAAIGKRVVYLSEHPALAHVETLVNARGDPERVPSVYQLLKIAVSDAVSIEIFDRSRLSHRWRSEQKRTRGIGDAWLANAPSALLAIPSAPSPESTNYLLNPLHPDARHCEIEWCRWIVYDQRLFGIREK